MDAKLQIDGAGDSKPLCTEQGQAVLQALRFVLAGQPASARQELLTQFSAEQADHYMKRLQPYGRE